MRIALFVVALLIASRSAHGATAYEANLAEGLLIDKWQRLVTEPAVVGEAELEKTWRQRNEKAQVDYAVVPSAGQAFSTRVTDDEAQAWYRAHQDDYRRGEGKKIRYVVVDRRTQEGGVARRHGRRDATAHRVPDQHHRVGTPAGDLGDQVHGVADASCCHRE